ncbi:MAG: hypothetical protein WAU51_00035, partial [Methanoregula sp.]
TTGRIARKRQSLSHILDRTFLILLIGKVNPGVLFNLTVLIFDFGGLLRVVPKKWQDFPVLHAGCRLFPARFYGP